MTENCECKCGGEGLGELTTADLIMLLNVMNKVKTDHAKGMRIAIREELIKRGITNFGR
jgi:hypothetical protein